MNPEASRREISASILEEASSWVVEFNEGAVDGGQRIEFNHWIRRSPEHVHAFLEISAAWEEAVHLDPQRKKDITKVVEWALAESNVVPLHGGPHQGASQTVSAAYAPAPHNVTQNEKAETPPRFTTRAWFAAAATLLVFAGGFGAWTALRWNIHTTGIGEQRAVMLADGSIIELNALSKVRIDFSDTQRVVNLLRGQALFRVAKDPTKPFIVNADRMRVRAVGTQFDVYRKASGTTVTVVEGSVAVLSSTKSSDTRQETANTPTLLSAGDQVTVTGQAALRTVRANVKNATAWTQRKVVFEETPLAQAVEEFNRYNTRRLVIEDISLEGFHVRGTFSATKPEQLAEFLEQRFDVRIQETSKEIKISRRSSDAQGN